MEPTIFFLSFCGHVQHFGCAPTAESRCIFVLRVVIYVVLPSSNMFVWRGLGAGLPALILALGGVRLQCFSTSDMGLAPSIGVRFYLSCFVAVRRVELCATWCRSPVREAEHTYNVFTVTVYFHVIILDDNRERRKEAGRTQRRIKIKGVCTGDSCTLLILLLYYRRSGNYKNRAQSL